MANGKAGAPVGNTNRRKGRLWQAAIERALAKRSRVDMIHALDDLAEKLLQKCDEGDMAALKELGDRIEGKSVQGVELTGGEGGPVQTSVQVEFIRPTP